MERVGKGARARGRGWVGAVVILFLDLLNWGGWEGGRLGGWLFCWDWCVWADGFGLVCVAGQTDGQGRQTDRAGRQADRQAGR